ncbi:MAG: hypothetical protein HOI47_26830, partial [Candidatus Scalindua sp.]|nr:hypothetical protein [Candidatus Scalindua sp.]
EQISSKLIEMADFDMPEDMKAHHTNERLHKYQHDLINKGTPQEEIEKNLLSGILRCHLVLSR